MRVLLVEDDAALGGVLRDILADEGHDVQWARHGAQALEELDRAAPDVMLVDLMMPVMDGWRFLDRARADERFRSIPAYILTASRDVRDAPDGVRVLHKPIDMDVLLTVLASARNR